MKELNSKKGEQTTIQSLPQLKGDESHLSYLCNFRFECEKLYWISSATLKHTCQISPYHGYNRMCSMINMNVTHGHGSTWQKKWKHVYLCDSGEFSNWINCLSIQRNYWNVSASEIIINVLRLLCECVLPFSLAQKRKIKGHSKRKFTFFYRYETCS